MPLPLRSRNPNNGSTACPRDFPVRAGHKGAGHRARAAARAGEPVRPPQPGCVMATNAHHRRHRAADGSLSTLSDATS
eukprot:SAG22_NODE_289_length_12942_cov_6.674531_9_plen_78_part_00